MLAAMALGAGMALAGPMPEWRQPGFPLRVVFTPAAGTQTNVILKLVRRGNMPVTRAAFYACTQAGDPLPFRVTHADNDEVVLQVKLPNPATEGPFLVYYGSNGPADGPPCPEAAPDPTPVAAGVFRISTKAIPTSWERLRHMMRTLRMERLRHQIDSFPEIRSVDADGERKAESRRTRRLPRIAAMRSFLLAPEEGLYRFAIDCGDAGFVLIDREVAAEWPGSHEKGDWQTGPPVFLKAGVHRIDVYNAFDAVDADLRVGWIPPKSKAVIPLAAGNLIGASEAMSTRTERINQALQPAFVATPLKAYSFRGHDAVFVPVEFRNNTASWVGETMTCRWSFGDGDKDEGDTVIHTYRYKTPDLVKASLEVRDPLGFVAACSDSVDCRQVEPEAYAVAFDFVGLSSVCYPRDRLAPYLRVKGEVPGTVRLVAEWDWVPRAGPAVKGQRDVTPEGAPVLLPLGHAAVGDMDSVRWCVKHAGVVLAQGTVRFLSPPFAALPARVDGDGLYDAAGTRLVLVADETAGRWSQSARPLVTASARGSGRVVCVDDSLAPAGATDAETPEPYHRVLARLLKGVTKDVRFVPLPEWDHTPQSYGPLRSVVDASGAVRDDTEVMVLSMGLRSMLASVDAAAFERQVAVLSDMIGGTRKIPMVLVTPPPYPADAERTRQYASVIRRVAEARGIPVADLYTTFRCVEGNWHALFGGNPLELSGMGQRLAAQQVAHALVGGETK